MFLKRIFFIIASFTLILFLITFSIPFIFSSKIGITFIKNRIEKQTNSKIEIESLNLSWFGKQSIKNFSYCDPNIDLKVDSVKSNLPLLSFYKFLNSYKKFNFAGDTDIENLNVNFHFPNLPKSNFYNVYALIKTKNNKLNSININAKTIENNSEGNLTASFEILNNNVKTKIEGKNIPTIGIDQLLFYNKKTYQNLLVDAIGSSFNISINSDLNNFSGPINIDFLSRNSKAKINFFIDKNILTLKDTATIVLALSPINPPFIKNINYLSSDISRPIVLKIYKDEFSLPINPFVLKNFKIKHASLDLNQLIVSNTGIIQNLTAFAKIDSKNRIPIWFTNINFQLQDGIINTDRMDFLIDDSIHMCTWGSLNLLEKSLHLYLGITQDTLQKLFGIKNLPEEYVVKIPIKGSIENPKIDISSASAKILALSTLQSSNKIVGFIGGVVAQFQKDKNIPKPKKPFPWDGNIKKSSKTQNNNSDIFKKK